jgi:hypothetical protein
LAVTIILWVQYKRNNKKDRKVAHGSCGRTLSSLTLQAQQESPQ